MWVILLSSVALAACSGGGESVSGPTASPQNFVSAQAAMEASAASYESQVQSFEGTMSIGVEAGGEDFSIEGEMKYVAPDQMFMKMDIPTVGETQILIDGTDLYFALDGEWYKGDASTLDLDLNLEEFEQYAKDRGPIDYSEALKGLRDLVKLSDEEIDGKTYWHYHASLDLSALEEELPEDVVESALTDLALNTLLGTSMEIYVDPVTLLPRRYMIEMSMSFGEESFTMKMAMDFEKYNEDVDMPDIPSDAQEFDPSDLSDFDFSDYES